MIDLSCTCGRTYQVPPTKAGRKLQCKRCGAVTRIPHPDAEDVFVVPFQVTEEAAEEPLDLAVAEPTHRCPSCGTTDDLSVVICVRCGYDWRTGQRLEHATQTGFDQDQALLEEAAVAKALQVTRWGLVCLSPIGVALGPVTLLKSLAAEHALPRNAPELEGLALARLQAAGGFVLWTALILAFAWWAQGRGEVVQKHLAIQCTGRLQLLGARIQREFESDPIFPTGGGNLRDELGAIAERDPALDAGHLRCPLAEDLYTYRTRDHEELTRGVDAGYLLIWDREPHADERGQTSYRALRFDGKVETFEDRETLEEGLARTPFGELASPSASPGASPQPSRAGQGGPPPTPPGARLLRFVALAEECDRRDPWLESGLVVEALIFTERTGIPPQDLLPIVLSSRDVKIRRYGVRMLARSQLGADKVEALVREVAKEADLDVRFAAARALQRVGHSFLGPLARVIEEADSDLKAAAIRMVGRQASEGRAQAELVLGLMAAIRAQAQAGGDDAMFSLPPAALDHVAPFLGHPTLGLDARAVFVSAGEDGLKALRKALQSVDSESRRGAFRVAKSLVEAEVFDLPGYLALVDQERDGLVQAQALEHFIDQNFAPGKVLTQWIVDYLRKTPPRGLALENARKVLSRVGMAPLPKEAGSVEQLVEALTLEGEPSEILTELGSEARLGDLELDEWIGARWKRFPEIATRRRLIDILALRPHESAQRALLLTLSDPEADVRAYGAKLLVHPRAFRSDRFRRDAARQLGKLLRQEKDPLVRQRFLELAKGKHFCGRYPADDKPAKHNCSEPILSYLRAQVKKGDRSALRCLAAHPSLQAVKSLIEVLKSTSRNQDLRYDISYELNNLTTVGGTAKDGPSWERQIAKRSAQLEKHLRGLAERERENIRRSNARATKLLKSLSNDR